MDQRMKEMERTVKSLPNMILGIQKKLGGHLRAALIEILVEESTVNEQSHQLQQRNQHQLLNDPEASNYQQNDQNMEQQVVPDNQDQQQNDDDILDEISDFGHQQAPSSFELLFEIIQNHNEPVHMEFQPSSAILPTLLPPPPPPQSSIDPKKYVVDKQIIKKIVNTAYPKFVAKFGD